MSSKYTEFLRASEHRRLLEQERLIVEATELIVSLMQKGGVTKAELARRLGRSRAYVTQLLRGPQNMTVRTFADVALALGARIVLRPASPEVRERASRPAQEFRLVPAVALSPQWRLSDGALTPLSCDASDSPPGIRQRTSEIQIPWMAA
jgi:transcriptional regulator with XRE-family HTH domain